MKGVTTSTRPYRTKPRSGERSWRSLVANVLPIATAVGLIYYATVRVAYYLFYQPVGVSPEEVGLGYQETIAQTVVGIVLFGLAFAIYLPLLIGPLLLLAFVGEPAFEWVAGVRRAAASMPATAGRVARLRAGWKSVEPDVRRVWAARYRHFWNAFNQLKRIAPWLLAFGFVLAIGSALSYADEAGKRLAATGELPTGYTVPLIGGIPLLPLRADPVEIAPPLGQRLGKLPKDTCLLFLGEANGRAVVFAYNKNKDLRKTLRIPSSSVVLITGPAVRDCASR